MKYDPHIQDRLQAAWDIFNQPKFSRQSVNAVNKLLKGLSPTLDRHLATVLKAWKKVDQLNAGDIVELTVDHLPDKTEKDKKQKKFLLLFIKSWNDLKSEVKRVKTEIENNSSKNPNHQAASTSRIIRFAKGPFGAITALATIIAASLIYLDTQAATVNIQNIGCQTIRPSQYSSIKLPGLQLPDQPIESGGSAVVTLPPLKLRVDATNPASVNALTYGANLNFDLRGMDVIYDGQSLVGQQTTIHLTNDIDHSVVLRCD